MKLLEPTKINPKNSKHEWLEKRYPGPLHLIFMQGQEAIYGMNKKYGLGFKHGYSIQTPEEFDWFWDIRELTRVRQIFLDKAKNDLFFFLAIYHQWESDHKKNIKVYGEFQYTDFTKLEDKELYDTYEKMYQANAKQAASGYLADAFLSSGEKDWLSEFIADGIKKEYVEEAITILSAPTIPSYVNEEETALAKIKADIKDNYKSFEGFLKLINQDEKIIEKLEKHTRKYYWVENNYFPKVLTVEDFTKKMYELDEVDHEKTLKENKKKKEKYLKELEDPYLTRVIRMSELATHMQDYRKMAIVRFAHFMEVIFKEIAERLDLTLTDMQNVVEPELKDIFLNRNIDKKKLKLRGEKSFLYCTQTGGLVLEGKDYKKYVNESDFIRTFKDVKKINGVTACKGKVKGVVRIINNAKTDEFKKGEILVTNNTTPEFVPMMKKAAAIVTEQGGITTHAAIISRELNIPCVIGTQIATKALKNGDKVEVDADKGIVKKIQ